MLLLVYNINKFSRYRSFTTKKHAFSTKGYNLVTMTVHFNLESCCRFVFVCGHTSTSPFIIRVSLYCIKGYPVNLPTIKKCQNCVYWWGNCGWDVIEWVVNVIQVTTTSCLWHPVVSIAHFLQVMTVTLHKDTWYTRTKEITYNMLMWHSTPGKRPKPCKFVLNLHITSITIHEAWHCL